MQGVKWDVRATVRILDCSCWWKVRAIWLWFTVKKNYRNYWKVKNISVQKEITFSEYFYYFDTGKSRGSKPSRCYYSRHRIQTGRIQEPTPRGGCKTIVHIVSLDIVIKTLGILKIVCLIDSIKELVYFNYDFYYAGQ